MPNFWSSIFGNDDDSQEALARAHERANQIAQQNLAFQKQLAEQARVEREAGRTEVANQYQHAADAIAAENNQRGLYNAANEGFLNQMPGVGTAYETTVGNALKSFLTNAEKNRNEYGSSEQKIGSDYESEAKGLQKSYLDPYGAYGEPAFKFLRGQGESLANDPASFINKLESSYRLSPGFAAKVKAAKEYSDIVAASGGYKGTTQQQEEMARTVSNLVSEDSDKYIGRAMGAYGSGMQQMGELAKLGYGASQSSALSLGDVLKNQALMAHQSSGNIASMGQQDLTNALQTGNQNAGNVANLNMENLMNQIQTRHQAINQGQSATGQALNTHSNFANNALHQAGQNQNSLFNQGQLFNQSYNNMANQEYGYGQDLANLHYANGANKRNMIMQLGGMAVAGATGMPSHTTAEQSRGGMFGGNK